MKLEMIPKHKQEYRYFRVGGLLYRIPIDSDLLATHHEVYVRGEQRWSISATSDFREAKEITEVEADAYIRHNRRY